MTENERIIRGNDPSFRLAATEEKGRSSLAPKDQPEEDARKNGQERITSARWWWWLVARTRTEMVDLWRENGTKRDETRREAAAGRGQRRKNGIRRLRVVIIINLSGI